MLQGSNQLKTHRSKQLVRFVIPLDRNFDVHQTIILFGRSVGLRGFQLGTRDTNISFAPCMCCALSQTCTTKDLEEILTSSSKVRKGIQEKDTKMFVCTFVKMSQPCNWATARIDLLNQEILNSATSVFFPFLFYSSWATLKCKRIRASACGGGGCSFHAELKNNVQKLAAHAWHS